MEAGSVGAGTDCNCFPTVLRASERLHKIRSTLETQPLDRILNTANLAAAIVEQYSNCPLCTDPAHFTVYIIVLRLANECYASIANPATASDDTLQTKLDSSHPQTVKLRIGPFIVHSPLHSRVRTAVIRSEIQRAVHAAEELGGALDSRSIKTSRCSWDEATLTYQRGLVEPLKSDLAATLHSVLTPKAHSD